MDKKILEKPINPTIEKLRALIKMQIRREELNFASLGGGGQTMNIGALEWVLKQIDSLQQKQSEKPNSTNWEQIEKRAKESEKALDYMREHPLTHEQAVEQSQRLKEEEKTTPAEGLEEELKLYCKQYYNYNYPEQEYYDSSPIMPHIIASARHFAQWQKEQMFKDAVEGCVSARFGTISIPHNIYEKYDGQNVKIIVVKEDMK